MLIQLRASASPFAPSSRAACAARRLRGRARRRRRWRGRPGPDRPGLPGRRQSASTALRRIGSSPVAAGEAAGGGAAPHRLLQRHACRGARHRPVVLAGPEPWRGGQPARCDREGHFRAEAGRQQAGRHPLRPRHRHLRRRERVHGRPMRTAHVPVAAPPPEDNTGPPARPGRSSRTSAALFEQAGPAGRASRHRHRGTGAGLLPHPPPPRPARRFVRNPGRTGSTGSTTRWPA